MCVKTIVQMGIYLIKAHLCLPTEKYKFVSTKLKCVQLNNEMQSELINYIITTYTYTHILQSFIDSTNVQNIVCEYLPCKMELLQRC